MRANALLKLLMGGAGGLVLAVAGVQCQPGVDNPIPNIYQATGVDDPGMDLGYIMANDLEWEPLYDDTWY
jgi:hypothetical protein